MLDVRAALSNRTLIHPPGFYVIGFTAMPHTHIYLIFLGVIYMLTVLFNCFLLSIICLDRKLHTPKFLAVANLAVVDTVFSSYLIPNMLWMYIFKDNFVPFNLCLVQMGVHYSCTSIQCFSLAVLAYDRLISICFPLRQHTINTNTNMLCILGSVWAVCVLLLLYSTLIIKRLSFCASVQVPSYFCDYSPVYRLACNDNSLQWATAVSLIIIIRFGPLSFILVSYGSILLAVFKMKNVGNRYKALATCTEHFIVVAIAYVPTLTMYMLGLFFYRPDPDIRIVTLSMSACMPPCLNPIVYSLKTKEITSKAQILLCKTCQDRKKLHPKN